MSRFVQLHLLTSYPPANLNRDDLGRPKTAMMGGEQRLRISSQSLKRAWRTSEVFENALAGHIGIRTKTMGETIFNKLYDKGIKQKEAIAWAKLIAAQFGKLKTLPDSEKKKLKGLDEDMRLEKELEETEIEQLVHFSPEEQLLIDSLVDALAERKTRPDSDELALLRRHHSAADIALFGRMLAATPRFNTEAAAQVAHAISVHSITVEDDYFTAIDDLNRGGAHLGETEFAAGLFYLYLCADKELLIANLSGNQQPRALSVAFLKPVPRGDMLNAAMTRLLTSMENMDTVYGSCADERCIMNVPKAEGSLQTVIECAEKA